jgi:hypothetical protein
MSQYLRAIKAVFKRADTPTNRMFISRVVGARTVAPFDRVQDCRQGVANITRSMNEMYRKRVGVHYFIDRGDALAYVKLWKITRFTIRVNDGHGVKLTCREWR